MKRWLRYIIRMMLLGIIVVLALPFVLYVPFIQDFIRNQAEQYVDKNTAMNLHVGFIGLSFPLRLDLERVQFGLSKKDTLMVCENLSVDVAFLPLLKGEVIVNAFTLRNASLNYADTSTHFALNVDVEHVMLDSRTVDLKKQHARLHEIQVEGAEVYLSSGISKPDTTASSPFDWIFQADKVSLRRVGFTMDDRPGIPFLKTHLENGLIETCSVDLGKQQVHAERLDLEQGVCDLFSAAQTEKTPPDTLTSTTADTTTNLWMSEVQHIRLSRCAFSYQLPPDNASFKRLAASEINLEADSVFNRGIEVRADIAHFSLLEQSTGLQLVALSGNLRMDDHQFALTNFRMSTPQSALRADLHSDLSLIRRDPQTPLNLKLEGHVGMDEVLKFLPDIQRKMGQHLQHKTLYLESDLSGTLASLEVRQRIVLPEYLSMHLDGHVVSVLTPARIAGNCRFNASLNRVGFLTSLLPDTSLRKKVALPDKFTLRGEAAFNPAAFVPQITLLADSGSLRANARIDRINENYQATLICDSFPISRFLPNDSLGRVGLHLEVAGKLFNPLRPGADASVDLKVNQLDFRSYNYGGLTLTAALKEEKLTAELTQHSPALRFGVSCRGEISQSRKTIDINGKIDTCNLYALNLTTERVAASLIFGARASVDTSGHNSFGVMLDRIFLWNKLQKDSIRRTEASLNLTPRQTAASLRSGDLTLEMKALTPLDTLLSGLKQALPELISHAKEQGLDMSEVNPSLPPLTIKASGGDQNILNKYLNLQGFGFKQIELDGTMGGKNPTDLELKFYKVNAKNIPLDTLSLSLRQQQQALGYNIRLVSRPLKPEDVASINLSGHIVYHTILLNCLQKNGKGLSGFDFSLQTQLSDSSVRVNMLDNPLLDFSRWNINPDNYILYQFHHNLSANLELSYQNQRFAILPGNKTGDVSLQIGGIDLAALSKLLIGSLPLSGTLSSNFTIGMDKERFDVDGRLSIKEFGYDKKRVADVDVDLSYRTDTLQTPAFGLGLWLDQAESLAAKGIYQSSDPEKPLDLQVDIPSLPLKILNAWLPSDAAQLQGNLLGHLNLAGSFNKPVINGAIRFTETSVQVPLIGTSFAITSDSLRIQNSRILFNNYSLIAPNKQPLSINGTVDATDFSRIITNVTLNTNDFQFINVPRNPKSLLYGTGYISLNASLRGEVGNMVVTGDLGVMPRTEVTYVMRDALPEMKRQNQDMVSFVSFSDSLAETPTQIQPVTIGGIDVQMNVNVDNNVKMALFLSDDGQNRINIQGGGNLSYYHSPLGDSRLSGRYVVSGGTVRYTPPLISEKIFAIQSGSYIEWTGELADPILHITAVQSIRTNVTTDDNPNGRPVTFDLTISILNTLEDLTINFGLSAPQDLYIQNQLASMTTEQQTSQALNLMVYNTYTGPGTKATGSNTNLLNSFIEKELNQWAQNSLKGINLSFGINTYGGNMIGSNPTRTDYSFHLSKSWLDGRLTAEVGGKFTQDRIASAQNQNASLINDVSLEYSLTKRANMFIKLFYKTDYPSILEGAVTDTGVGFVVRKKMLKLGDLFRLMRHVVNAQSQEPKPSQP